MVGAGLGTAVGTRANRRVIQPSGTASQQPRRTEGLPNDCQDGGEILRTARASHNCTRSGVSAGS